MIDVLERKRISPIFTYPGDTIILSHNDDKLLTKDIDKEMTIDEVAIFEFKDEFGMEDGIGGAFGKHK